MRWHAAALSLLLATAGCGEQTVISASGPREPDQRAVGYYCGMSLSEHTGSYGQLLLAGWEEPLWFSSVRDALNYVGQDLVNENEIAGFWVNDMGADPLGKPAPDTWIEAKSAWYVVGSRKRAAMGGLDVVPFKDRIRADAFSSQHGGRVVVYAAARAEIATGSFEEAFDGGTQ